MAYNNAEGRAEYTAVVGQTDFSFVFKIYEPKDLVVWLTPTGQEPDDVLDKLVLGADYTVVVNGDNGGTLTLTNTASAGDYVTLVRTLETTRDTEYQSSGELRPEVLNSDQNYQTYLIADQKTRFDKVVRLPENSQGTSGELPAPVGDAYLKWKADGSRLENDTTIPDAVGSSAANAAAALASEQAAAASEAAALASENHIDARLDTPQTNGSTVVENIDKMSSDPEATQLANAEANAQTATTKAAEASTSANNAQLAEWRAEAWEKTANSYANEAEDVLVKLYTSNGDGTFTPSDTTDYSALHYKLKAQAYAASIDPAQIVHKTDYATSTVAGAIKARVAANTLYLSIDATDA